MIKCTITVLKAFVRFWNTEQFILVFTPASITQQFDSANSGTI